MCVCDLSFKCVCAIWEGYISNPPARGWSSPSRRPRARAGLCAVVTVKRRRPVSLCHLVQLTCSPGYLFTSGHLVTWSSASHLVIWSSGQLVVWRLASVLSACRLAAASILAHLSRDRGSPIHSLQIHLLAGNLCLLSQAFQSCHFLPQFYRLYALFVEKINLISSFIFHARLVRNEMLRRLTKTSEENSCICFQHELTSWSRRELAR